MAEQSSIQGRDLENRTVTLSKEQPYQLSLFQYFLPDAAKYSNTIELYDAIPKYFTPSRQMQRLREGGKYLPTLERSFQHKNQRTGEDQRYHVTIHPARIRSAHDQQEREYYPSAREELVEEALRKIASDQQCGLYLDERAGVQFTLRQLQKELSRRGHGIHLDSLKDALGICHSSRLALSTPEGTEIISGSIFPVLLMAKREVWQQSPNDARCYVQFHPLITQSINGLTYRQYDYAKFMEHDRQLSRWLHKRLSHNYVFASMSQPYTIRASTILRDSGLISHERFRDRLTAIDDALEEIQAKGVIYNYEKSLQKVGRKLADATYSLFPTYEFVEEMKLANTRRLQIQQKAKTSGYS